MSRRVLVTGGNGFVGRHAVAALEARGFEAHAPTRDAADLLDPAARRALVAAIRPSHMLHLAWEAEPGRYWASPDNLAWVAASLDLARLFVEAGGGRMVAAGTCAEYEWGSARLHESTTPLAPATLYGAAKDGLRRILEAYATAAGLSLAWGRLFHLHGPGERPGRLVSDAALALLAGEAFPTTHGRQRRDFLHVADAADALAALLASPVEGAVNIGSGRATPVRALLEAVARETGRAELIGYGARALGASEPEVIEADVTRLTVEVGFRPRHTIESGIADAVAWQRSRLSLSRASGP